MATLRACHNVAPSRKYAAEVHKACQFSDPSLNMA